MYVSKYKHFNSRSFKFVWKYNYFVVVIVLQVFRGSSKRRNAANVQIGLKHPECPPSPDLSGLTEEEISVLKDVFRREEEFESEIGGRQQYVSNDIFSSKAPGKKRSLNTGISRQPNQCLIWSRCFSWRDMKRNICLCKLF